MNSLQLAGYAGVSLATSILSGVAGGGAGFVNAPVLMLFGLSPAQAIATGKLTGLSVAVASLGGLRGFDHRQSKKQLLAIIGIALIAGIFAPFVITSLDSAVYRRIMGFVILAMIPVLLMKKVGHTAAQPRAWQQAIGYALLVPALLLQGIFGAGMGTLVNIVLMVCMGMPALESSVAKRYSQAILNIVIVFGVLASHLIVWSVALIGILTAAAGGYIGTRLAVRRGDNFVLGTLIILAFASAVFLFIS